MTNQSNTPPLNANTRLDEARSLHRAGKLRGARAAYEVVLANDNSSLAATLELGQVLIEMELPVEASALFHGQIDRHPTDSDLRLALGIALMEQGEPWIAAPVFLKASRLAPGRLPARLMLAKSLIATSRSKEALSVLQQTALDFPEAPDVWAQRGALERSLGNQIEAEQSYRRQLALTPDDFNALNNLGVILRAAGRLGEAVSIYRQALAIAPTSALVHANLGNALDARGKAHEAEAHLREAVRYDWASIDARYNLAAHLVREEKPDEAISHLRFVVTEAPQRWDAWTNLGVAQVATGQMDEAEKCYRTAITLRPATPEPHYNLAWLLLLMGLWQEGWREYEWRWQLPLFSTQKRQGLAAPWNGSVQANATILLRCEQGLGDSIQFVRLAASARKLCKRTILECPASLLQLFENIEGVDEVIPFGTELPHHDFYANLMSLPGLLHLTPDSIPKTDAYILATHTSPSRLILPVSSRPKVGFVWAGSPNNMCAVSAYETELGW